MNSPFLNEIDGYIAAKRYRLINSVLVYHHGEIILERYYNNSTPDTRNNLMSVWKSILSLTLGICLAQGRLPGLDEPVSKYLPYLAKNRHPLHRLITVRHLLTMSSGIYWQGGVHYNCPMMNQMRASNGNWEDFIADIPVAHTPGTKFQYKEWDVILLSALIRNAAGRTPYEICRDYLYAPLEIESGEWPQTPCGIVYNALPGMEASDLSARDLIKIGVLALNRGVWDGKRIVPAEYIRQCAEPSAAFGGYGLLWWLTDKGFHGRGFGGQELNVYPAKNAVAVIQAKVSPQSKSYGDVCEKIMGGMSDG